VINTVAIINYGMGNLGSISNMVRKVGGIPYLAEDISAIQNATKIILPGVGSFDNGMTNLKQSGFAAALTTAVVRDKIPILGICLGMQLFSRRSDEGTMPGLGWLNADTVKFDFGANLETLKVPHMGWNTISVKKQCKVLSDIEDDARFYFVHSYHMKCDSADDVLAVTKYGYEFASAVSLGNIFGVQFHPEKSHRYGMQILRNFVENV
jgi:glutamine amidotransferase